MISCGGVITKPFYTLSGKCEKEIQTICDKDIEQGEARLASCIGDAIAESESGAEGGKGAAPCYTLAGALLHPLPHDVWIPAMQTPLRYRMIAVRRSSSSTSNATSTSTPTSPWVRGATFVSISID